MPKELRGRDFLRRAAVKAEAYAQAGEVHTLRLGFGTKPQRLGTPRRMWWHQDRRWGGICGWRLLLFNAILSARPPDEALNEEANFRIDARVGSIRSLLLPHLCYCLSNRHLLPETFERYDRRADGGEQPGTDDEDTHSPP